MNTNSSATRRWHDRNAGRVFGRNHRRWSLAQSKLQQPPNVGNLEGYAVIPTGVEFDRCTLVMAGEGPPSTPLFFPASQGVDGGPAAAMTLRSRQPEGQTQGPLVLHGVIAGEHRQCVDRL